MAPSSEVLDPEHQAQARYGSIKNTRSVATGVEDNGILAPRRTNAKNGKNPMIVACLVCFTVAAAVFASQQPSDASSQLVDSSASAQVLQIEKSSSHCDECKDPPHYYHGQLVDHFDDENEDTWTQRYYIQDKHFGGPGHPIFLVMGGEGEALGLYYPFVNDHLAKIFKAYVLQPELRFYGKSVPIKIQDNTDLVGLLTTEQAMADFLQLLAHTKKKLGCSDKKSSKHYCPVITVGGSYPGFLSAMMRIVHPDVIDISYAASAPMHLYAQQVNPDDYFELVTRVAETSLPGCAGAVRAALDKLYFNILNSASYLDEAKKLNICLDSIPDYITSKEIFANELMMMVGAHFADFNMEYYPPTAERELPRACGYFMDRSLDLYGKFDKLFQLIEEMDELESKSCGFDLMTQVPSGSNATISAADWTGIGPGDDGLAWEFQCCTELVVQTSFSEKSMFHPKPWTLERLTKHCQARFGVTPAPTHLVDTFKFNDLSNSSRILFTNGLNDGWSASSILASENPNIVVMNFPNGAHHSDIAHDEFGDRDTEDIKLGHQRIIGLMGLWLDEIKEENKKHKHHHEKKKGKDVAK